MHRSMRREAALRENQGKPHQGPSCKVIPTNRVGAAAMPTCRRIADPDGALRQALRFCFAQGLDLCEKGSRGRVSL